MSAIEHLSTGQMAVLNAWARTCKPSRLYDPDIHALVPTESIHLELKGAIDITMNEIADYLVGMGYVYLFDEYGAHGWIIRDYE